MSTLLDIVSAYDIKLRQVRMWDRCDFGSPRAELIQQTWIPLFTPRPPPPDLTPEEFGQMMQKNTEAHLERIWVAVEKVRARGGRVRDLENQFSPREKTRALMPLLTTALAGS